MRLPAITPSTQPASNSDSEPDCPPVAMQNLQHSGVFLALEVNTSIVQTAL